MNTKPDAVGNVKPATAAHGVHVQGDGLRSFNSRDAAMTFAEGKVYLNPKRKAGMLRRLAAGKQATWCYGFSTVTVYPGIP